MLVVTTFFFFLIMNEQKFETFFFLSYQINILRVVLLTPLSPKFREQVVKSRKKDMLVVDFGKNQLQLAT